ncbi:hypothetical protein G6F57_017257 [Rhizopus arrhizus]|nr:hypothetical protein G6F65_013189 [Rhizopus arrhizus]KAG1446702.1 hypothetical protein G6F57_017257 [Rhizopus arrhizus]
MRGQPWQRECCRLPRHIAHLPLAPPPTRPARPALADGPDLPAGGGPAVDRTVGLELVQGAGRTRRAGAYRPGTAHRPPGCGSRPHQHDPRRRYHLRQCQLGKTAGHGQRRPRRDRRAGVAAAAWQRAVARSAPDPAGRPAANGPAQGRARQLGFPR